MMRPTFHTLSQLVAIHHDQISRYGGVTGIRDVETLKSAAVIPRAAYGGLYLHTSIPDMASAYLYHIITGRPFLDGNRRVGVTAALSFLYRNGWNCTASGNELYRLASRIGAGGLDKTGAMVSFAAHTVSEQNAAHE